MTTIHYIYEQKGIQLYHMYKEGEDFNFASPLIDQTTPSIETICLHKRDEMRNRVYEVTKEKTKEEQNNLSNKPTSKQRTRYRRRGM